MGPQTLRHPPPSWNLTAGPAFGVVTLRGESSHSGGFSNKLLSAVPATAVGTDRAAVTAQPTRALRACTGYVS